MLRAFLPVLLVASSAGAQQFVVPSAYATTPGTAYNYRVFWKDTVTRQPVRTQMIYDTADIAPGVATLKSISFRRPNYSSVVNPVATATLSVICSVGPNDSATCSTTYANNTGANAATTFNGPISLPAALQAPGVAPFTLTIPFTTNFLYVGSMGKGLVADVRTTAYTPVAPGRHWYLDVATNPRGKRTTVWNPGLALCQFNNGTSATGLSSRVPELGNIWYAQYNNCPTGLLGYAALGTQGPGSAGLPIPLGAPNCALAINPNLIVIPLTTGTSGHARWPDVPVPNNFALIGISFFDQGIFLDSVLNLPVLTLSSKWVVGMSTPPKGNHIYNFGDNPPASSGHKFDQAVIARFDY